MRRCLASIGLGLALLGSREVECLCFVALDSDFQMYQVVNLRRDKAIGRPKPCSSQQSVALYLSR